MSEILNNDSVYRHADSGIPSVLLSPDNKAFISTPEFREFFNGSKMVHPVTGEPQVWYHGTNRQFDISSPRHSDGIVISNFGFSHDALGTYFTDTKDFAFQYADPIGVHFDTNAIQFCERLGHEPRFDTFVRIWNGILWACQERDDTISIINDRHNLHGRRQVMSIDEFNQAIVDGIRDFGLSFHFHDKLLYDVGTMLQMFGGKFPDPEEKLTPYRSLYPKAESVIGQLAVSGLTMMNLERSASRIIPAFIKSYNPLVKEAVLGASGDPNIDLPFREGFEEIAANLEAEYDSIIVRSDDRRLGVNLVVPDSRQIREAPTI